jgi:hypothetical protein
MSIQKVYYNMKLKEIILILYNMIYKKKGNGITSYIDQFNQIKK